MGLQVVELQEGALGTSLSVVGDEATLPPVTVPDPALDVTRDVARSEHVSPTLVIRPGTDSARRPGLRRRAKLFPFDLLEEQGEGAIEDRCRITVRNLATEKGLQASKLVVALLADRELDAIAVWRGVVDDRTA
jgi:hypothetical protein